ncbi:MAG: asparagine--tRNA ligase, partial [Butyrivibrio sp.]|nr:asparagine--tRNA ligase [Butyrivibrio sp.]
MELTDIRSLFQEQDKYTSQKVTVGGWIRNIRDSKTIGFIMLNDGTYFKPLQVVYTNELANFADISKLNVGAAVIVTGNIVATPDAKQPFEMQAETVEIEGLSTPDYPLQPKRHTLEYLRTIPHLRARTNTFEAVFRVRSVAA